MRFNLIFLLLLCFIVAISGQKGSRRTQARGTKSRQPEAPFQSIQEPEKSEEPSPPENVDEESGSNTIESEPPRKGSQSTNKGQPQNQPDGADESEPSGGEEAGPEPPALVPQTAFTCEDKPYQPGMYADMEVDCSVYHLCFDGRKESFLCGTGTMFNQEILSCDHPQKVNCGESPKYYEANTELGKPGAEPSSQPAPNRPTAPSPSRPNEIAKPQPPSGLRPPSSNRPQKTKPQQPVEESPAIRPDEENDEEEEPIVPSVDSETNLNRQGQLLPTKSKTAPPRSQIPKTQPPRIQSPPPPPPPTPTRPQPQRPAPPKPSKTSRPKPAPLQPSPPPPSPSQEQEGPAPSLPSRQTGKVNNKRKPSTNGKKTSPPKLQRPIVQNYEGEAQASRVRRTRTRYQNN